MAGNSKKKRREEDICKQGKSRMSEGSLLSEGKKQLKLNLKIKIPDLVMNQHQENNNNGFTPNPMIGTPHQYFNHYNNLLSGQSNACFSAGQYIFHQDNSINGELNRSLQMKFNNNNNSLPQFNFMYPQEIDVILNEQLQQSKEKSKQIRDSLNEQQKLCEKLNNQKQKFNDKILENLKYHIPHQQESKKYTS